MDFPQFDEKIASSFTGMIGGGGLPEWLGIKVTEMGPGWMTAELPVTPALLNPFGTTHGGVLASLIDHVLGTVLYPVMPRGYWAATTQLNVNLTGSIRDGLLEARSEIISMSKTIAVVRIDVHNDGRLVGAAQGTVVIMPPRQ